MKISFVIPCYRSTRTLPGVIDEIKETMSTLNEYVYEIILVNDCSPDDTFETIKKLASENENIKGLSLAKNFGQHGALMAGFHEVTGDIVVCLDDDGQTPANEVNKLLDGINNGADVVYASYSNKKHSPFRNFGSWINDKMACKMLGKPKELKVSSYFAARRYVLDEMVKYTGAFPYVIGLVLRTTKNIINVPVNHRNREVGESGYTLGKLLGLWFNGFTSFSIKPLRVATTIGGISAAAGFIYGIYTIIKKIWIRPEALVIGFSALMSVLVFMGGMILLMLGLVGEYLGRTYINLNNSPQYVVSERTESDK